jgi:intracellular multiplication protein IcmE
MSSDDNMIDDDLDLGDEGFDDFGKKGSTLADLWRDNPMVKVGGIAAGVVVIFGAIMMLGGGGAETPPSMLPAGNDVNAPPATMEISPAYRDEIIEQNERNLEKAIDTGESTLPTPIDTPLDSLSIPRDQQEEEDPLQRWRRLQEERMDRELANTQSLAPPAAPQNAGPNEAVQQLAGLMAEQMQAILESRSVGIPVQKIQITDPSYLEELAAKKEAAAAKKAQLAAQAAGEGPVDPTLGKVLVPAGEILYAQLLTEANSDNPGPVLAQIMVGPLAGSRILGDFEESEGVDVLTLSFDTVVIDGESVDMDGIALDPNTSLPGLATEVDHRYLRRIAVPAAVTFIQGAAEAIANTGLTTVTINGESVAEETEESDTDQEIASGVEEAAAEVAEILEEEADDIETLIIIEAGTPFGLLLLEPIIPNPVPEEPVVVEEDEDGQVPFDLEDFETFTSGM